MAPLAPASIPSILAFPILILCFLLPHADANVEQFIPEQVKLTFHAVNTKLTVSWVTFEISPFLSLVQWGSSSSSSSPSSPSSPSSSFPQFSRNGTYLSYVNDICNNFTRSVHSVDFDVPEGALVFYRVSSDGLTFSPIFNTTGLRRETYPQVVALWGDMGIPPTCQVSSVPQIARDLASGKHQYMIHYGDTAYNMDDNCGQIGDDFLNAAMAYSTSAPIVYGNGNHEGGPLKQYHEFTSRLGYGQESLAESSQSNSTRYVLWSVGPVTYFTLDPDAWIYPLVYSLAQPQYEWLDAALARVNRTETPWLVACVHRAMYCTKTDDPECNSEAMTLRYGWFFTDYGIEALLQKYGVDLYFAGHTHHYERTYPVREGMSTQYDYINPKATVHIQSGIAGVDGYDPFNVTMQEWEAFRDTEYRLSYSRVTFHNETHATVEQLSGVDGSMFDSFTVVQNTHGPF